MSSPPIDNLIAVAKTPDATLEFQSKAETGPAKLTRDADLATQRIPTVHRHEVSRESHIFRYGEYFDSFLATESDREEFWSSSREGLISYRRWGSHVLVGGGLIAPDKHKPQLLKEFIDFLKQRQWAVAFHNIGDHELLYFRQHGFQITKWGEEPIIDLGGITWEGKAYEWVRRQTNYCRRHGLQVFEVFPHALTPEQWNRTLAEMMEVSTACLGQKPQGEMTFFEGRLGNQAVGSRRVFIARSGEGLGRIEGFVLCNPIRNGTAWSLEMYRRRPDAVRGTVAFLFHKILSQMQEEGVQRVTFCLVPGLRCRTKRPGDSPLIRLLMVYGAWLGVVMDVAGMQHFKSRFRPRYENRYVCVKPEATISTVLAFAVVSGLFAVSPWKVAKLALRRFFKRAQRRTLDDLD